MEDFRWSSSEQKIAKALFERALNAELQQLLEKFKTRAATIETAEEMWKIGEYLKRKEREINNKYDYRYSQLIFFFAKLLREQRITIEELRGLDDKKIAYITGIADL